MEMKIRFKDPEKVKKLKIITGDGELHTIHPGENFTLEVDLDFSKNKSSIDISIPVTFYWDGDILKQIDMSFNYKENM